MKMRDVYSHFNLSSDPFTREIKTENLKTLPGVSNALEQLQILFDTKGIGILTGKSGSGKTCVLRMASDSLHQGTYESHYICHTSVGIQEFYSHLCHTFGLQPCGRRAPMYKAVHEHILNMHRTKHVHPILIIDEADKLGNDILQEIRLIANFNYDSLNAVTILLCGQEPLIQKLGLSSLESLANSVTVTVRMDTLKKEETFSYIEQRIGDVSSGASIFTKPSMNLIHDASSGVMRVINNMAQHALIKAYLSGNSTVEKEHVQSVLSR
ncbi:AAA family ATPase [Oceanispirochaeta sp.]|jgi:general secretion pathway protein A|uniref:ExeA family protein n=1 Tax=Oceanispirochaeta sp. TaxID=2035350 RepID=UPI00260F8CED|nr:AAA family ATPase [Oceanispirochaeta sp.]MDA3955767.1 AAA family ATPase [Oceanispirochaeta sp.]